MSALEEDIAALKTKITSLENEITSKQESLSNYVRSKFPATEEDLFRNDSYFKRLDNQLTSLNNQLTSLNNQLTSLNNQLTSLNNQLILQQEKEVLLLKQQNRQQVDTQSLKRKNVGSSGGLRKRFSSLNILSKEIEIQQDQKLWSIEELDLSSVRNNLIPIIGHININPDTLFQQLVINGVNIMSTNNLPQLLLHDLDALSINIEKLKDHILKNKAGFAILGSSGTGKTRMIFEYLSRNYGLYFSLSSSNTYEYGNSDMKYLLDRLGEFIDNSHTTGENIAYVKHFVECMVVARLYLLSHLLKDYAAIMTPKLWLFIQLFPNRCDGQIEELFSTLTEEFRRLSRNDLSKMLSDLKKELKMKKFLPIFLDESQNSVKTFEQKFKSPSSGKEYSLFYALGKSFQSVGYYVCSGTGLRIQEVEPAVSSMFSKSMTESRFIVSNVWRSIEDINSYYGRFFRGSKLESNIGSWFIGRVRPLASFIEFLLRSGSNDDIESKFDQFLLHSTTRDISPPIPSLMVMLNDDRFPQGKSHDMKEILRQVTYFRLCFGESYPVAAEEHAFLFENGYGLLNESTDKSLFVTVDDPLMLQTSINYFGGGINVFHFLGNIAEQRIAGDRQPSSRGYLWEEFIPLALIKFFENNKSVTLKLFGDNSEIPAEIWRPSNRIPHQNLLTSSSSQSLSEYLKSPKTAFYSPCFEAGPDIVFFLSVAGDRIPVFVQLKYSDNVKSRKAALATTNPAKFYNQKSGIINRKFKAEATACVKHLKKCQKHFGILIAYPMEWKSTLESSNSSQFGTRFEKVFDAKNAADIFEEAHLEFLDHLSEGEEYMQEEPEL